MDWSTVRAEFPVTRQWAFFDHAAVSPLPARTAAVLREFADDMSAGGSTRVRAWVDRAEATRSSIAKLVGGDPRGIALVKNTTEAIGFVAEGYPWKPGDNVVLPADEYPSNQYPWLNLESRGVSVRRVPPRGNRVELSDLRDTCDHRTRMIAVSFVGYASGFRVDVAALVQLARERNAHLMVDAIQGLGVLPFDLQQTPIDFVACGSHKWLLGPQGAGFLYIRPHLIDMLHPMEVGAASVMAGFDYSRIEFELKPTAARWEGGTTNFGGFAAFGASIDLLLGTPGIPDRVRHLTGTLCTRAECAGLKIFSSRSGYDWSGIVSFDLGSRDVAAAVKRCRDAGIVVSNRGGRLRAAPHIYNSEDEIDRLIGAISQPE
ncbi:MAG: aminotransferase class V-fold PLP-dependent enzyme [Gemmataceae bacterium]